MSDLVAKQIAEAYQALETARLKWTSAKDATSMARSHETQCYNDLNEAQKAFDAVVEEANKPKNTRDYPGYSQR